ncbi:MAG: hypothetical protein ACLU3F_15575 [Blautia wexlerae]
MIYTVTLNPALDKTVQIPSFRLGEVNRISAMRTDPGGKGHQRLQGLRSSVNRRGRGHPRRRGRAEDRIRSRARIQGLHLCTGHETRTNLKIVDPAAHQHRRQQSPVSRRTKPSFLSFFRS